LGKSEFIGRQDHRTKYQTGKVCSRKSYGSSLKNCKENYRNCAYGGDIAEGEALVTPKRGKISPGTTRRAAKTVPPFGNRSMTRWRFNP